MPKLPELVSKEKTGIIDELNKDPKVRNKIEQQITPKIKKKLEQKKRC